jgi:23S rRNA pseudouridine1911/1915/1917 synthase
MTSRPRPQQEPLPARGSLVAPPDVTVAAALRAHLPGRSWREVRRLCESGKVTVDDVPALDPARRLGGGERVGWDLARADPGRAPPPAFRIVFEDGHVVVIEKPAGVSSVPYDRKETGSALDLVRAAWRRQGRPATVTPLYTVHRLDKDTSGLLCFAKTKLAERALHRVFKRHLAEREYIAVAHGHMRGGTIASRLVQDRGDGLRGSSRRGAHDGQHAVTHVSVEERLAGASLCRVRLETGRTHQIRIHLAEQGHPLVGETVYVRDFRKAGGVELPAARLLLHAATLGFPHPVTGKALRFESEPPEEFRAAVARLRAQARGGQP